MIVRLFKIKKKTNLALLIRDLPRNVTETDIRSMLNQYTGYQIKKIEISRSKRYALVQMNDSIEAGYLLNVFNKIAPYINNDRGSEFGF